MLRLSCGAEVGAHKSRAVCNAQHRTREWRTCIVTALHGGQVAPPAAAALLEAEAVVEAEAV